MNNNSTRTSLGSNRVLALGTALFMTTILTTGCEPVAEATPGVYAGKTDQLTSADTASRTGTLQKRFQLVQADR